MNTEHLEQMAAQAKATLEERHQARESVLKQSRLLIQTCSKSIKHVHRRQFDQALVILEEAKTLSAAMRAASEGHPEVLYAGYIQDSEKELVEAAALIAICLDSPLPSPDDLGVGVTSWLNGLGEAASEVRRYVLDDMRSGDLERAGAMLRAMEAIYDELTTFDFPDALTGGLRRTCDALRAVIERTRSDLTLTLVQAELLAELRRRPS